ncbi:undecaprenyl-diphosphate phosphatase [Blattabacterium cuenoti]|uniref:undecaprenyl-diphosphate phosphatase n=1 Tax=Blattabacterium cuenoti TaxID=1653831 RepID=UPI00163BE3A3|nr:undecaprenyl-diphosphate phosphatase [Blattabacterium cuenoti]
MNYIQSVILGVIEGITEFFPISSTGHMIIAAYLMRILDDRITNLFLTSVQIGSILSIIFLYRKKIFFQKFNFYFKIFISSFPICILGFLVQKKTDIFFDNPLIVAISLFIGGLIILQSENLYEKNILDKTTHITYYKAFIIGLFQCISLIPGTSRSASTIISCMLQNINRIASIEFSFFLSIPVIIIATCKKLFDYYYSMDFYFFFKEMKFLLLGNTISFFTSIMSVKYCMKYLKNHSFRLFGYYRIFLSIIFLMIHYLVQPIQKF